MTKREMDVKIVEKVFGYTVEHLNQKAGWRIDYRAARMDDGGNGLYKNPANEGIVTDWGTDGYRLKNFSTDISYAFELIKILEDQGKAVIIQNDTHETNKVWYVKNYVLGYGRDMMSRGWKEDEQLEIEAKTLPEAICLFMIKNGVRV